jgi:hypothetical protein
VGVVVVVAVGGARVSVAVGGSTVALAVGKGVCVAVAVGEAAVRYKASHGSEAALQASRLMTRGRNTHKRIVCLLMEQLPA